MTRNSCCPLPAFRRVIVASFRCCPVAHAFSSNGEALSILWVKERSLKLAFPAPPPPPLRDPDTERDTPQDQLKSSISSLCLLSTDSPLMSPIFAKMSDATTTSYDARQVLAAASRHQRIGLWSADSQAPRRRSVASEIHTLSMRMYFHAELLLLLRAAGFNVSAVHGDHQQQPATADSDFLVYTAKRN